MSVCLDPQDADDLFVLDRQPEAFLDRQRQRTQRTGDVFDGGVEVADVVFVIAVEAGDERLPWLQRNHQRGREADVELGRQIGILRHFDVADLHLPAQFEFDADQVAFHAVAWSGRFGPENYHPRRIVAVDRLNKGIVIQYTQLSRGATA